VPCLLAHHCAVTLKEAQTKIKQLETQIAALKVVPSGPLEAMTNRELIAVVNGFIKMSAQQTLGCEDNSCLTSTADLDTDGWHAQCLVVALEVDDESGDELAYYGHRTTDLRDFMSKYPGRLTCINSRPGAN
jgi:hypothetical protein